MLPCDLLAPVRVLRERDFRALALLEDVRHASEGLSFPEANFAPSELLAHFCKAWGDRSALARVLAETWVRAWSGWE